MSNKEPEDNSHLYNRNILPDRKTQSGKRSAGRPQGAENHRTILKRLLLRKCSARGSEEKLTVFEWVIKILKNEADNKANFRAIMLYDKIFSEDIEPVVENSGTGVLLVPADLTQEEFIEKYIGKNSRYERLRKEVMAELSLKS